MNPPLPETDPPLAVNVPSTLAVSSAQTIILPPSPLRFASALIAAFGPKSTMAALRSGPRPRKLPPSSTVPPPVSPDTSIVALPETETLLPSKVTTPPLPSDARASTAPSTAVVPFSLWT